jgi:PqqD family protein of HPr-rel-A system
MGGAATSSAASRWRVDEAVRWRDWEGEIVAYSDRTGDTHHLADLSAWLFARLARGAVDEPSLAQDAAETVELPAGTDLCNAVAETIALLARLRLVASEPGA